MVYKEIALFTLAYSKRSDSGERSLRSKRFQSSYWAKVRAEAKKRFMFFLLLSQLSRRTLRGNACHAGYGERCEVKKAMKSRGGLEREVPSLTLSSIFSRSFLLRTAPHYLNARNWLFVHALWCFKILKGLVHDNAHV